MDLSKEKGRDQHCKRQRLPHVIAGTAKFNAGADHNKERIRVLPGQRKCLILTSQLPLWLVHTADKTVLYRPRRRCGQAIGSCYSRLNITSSQFVRLCQSLNQRLVSEINKGCASIAPFILNRPNTSLLPGDAEYKETWEEKTGMLSLWARVHGCIVQKLACSCTVGGLYERASASVNAKRWYSYYPYFLNCMQTCGELMQSFRGLCNER